MLSYAIVKLQVPSADTLTKQSRAIKTSAMYRGTHARALHIQVSFRKYDDGSRADLWSCVETTTSSCHDVA